MLTEINDPALGAERIGQIQSGILRKVYTDEYPSSACSAAKAIEDVKNGVQRVIFWGKDMRSLAESDGGTVALVESDMPGLIEMCRAGASVNTGEGMLAVRKLLNHFHASESSHDSLFVTTRNCENRVALDGTPIEWGKAIFAIFNRIREFAFLWHAPWYVMPGGRVEFLDIRVCHRNQPQVCRFLRETPLWIADPAHRQMVREMLVNGYATEPILPSDMPVAPASWGEYAVDRSDHGKKNTLLFVPVGHSGEWRPFQDFLECDGFPIKTVRMDLSQNVPGQTYLQTELERHGFLLTGIMPSETSCYGFWSRIDPSVPLADPVYIGRESTKAIESQSSLYARYVR